MKRTTLVFVGGAFSAHVGRDNAYRHLRGVGLAVVHDIWLGNASEEVLRRSDHLLLGLHPRTHLIDIARECDIPVWIEGETGTLAEFIATLTGEAS